MNGQSYLILVMAAAFMIINLCGAAFTIVRVRRTRASQRDAPSAGTLSADMGSALFPPTLAKSKALVSVIVVAVAIVILGVAGQALGIW